MNIERFSELVSILVAQAIKDNNEGEQNFSIRLSGNWEPEDNEIKKVVQKAMSSGELMLNDLHVVYDGEHTVVSISAFDVRHVVMYIKDMEAKIEAIENPEFAIKALAKELFYLMSLMVYAIMIGLLKYLIWMKY